ncbi:MAG: pentapeptide repeat-containing protein, partial [Polyangiaceae bacterium]
LQHPQGKEGAEEIARQREAAGEARKSSPDRRATGDPTRPKRASVRAKKPDITSRQKAIKKRIYTGDDPFTPTQARIGGVVGVVLIGFACILAYTSMKVNIVGLLMLVIGAGGLSLFLPTFGDREDVSRIAGMALCAVIAFLADPLENLALSGRQAKLKSGSPSQRAEIVKRMRLDGWGDFADIDLNGADLSGTDFSMAGFDRANLRDANFSGCNFEDVSFEEADLTNANFKEAKMPFSMFAVKGWRKALCDQKTQMPDEWQCSDGHPHGGGDEEEEEDEAQ